MFFTSRIGSPIVRGPKPVHFGAIYRISDNSEQEIFQASTKLQDAGVFISRFFQGEDRYLAANEKVGRNGREPGQDASAVTEVFKLKKSIPNKFTRILRKLILDKQDKGEIKNLSEVEKHPIFSSQRASTSEFKQKTKFPTTVFSDNIETMYDSEGGPEW